jgi:hypothetical protein
MPSKRGKTESDEDSNKVDTKKRGKSHPQEFLTARRLSEIAIAIAVLALVIAFIIPGPAPSGSIMAQHSVGRLEPMGSTCTHYPGAEVSISVPAAGIIVVSATVNVGIDHTFGFSDEARIVVATSSTECTFNNYTGVVSVPFSLPTDSLHYETVPLLRPFSVSGAGTVTFYVNGFMFNGANLGDRFDSASLVAVYYPR